MHSTAAFTGLIVLVASSVATAQAVKPAEPPRVQATLDAASIRRQAASMAEFKALLADPDPNIRLLAMREAIRAGDAMQRQMAIEAGLASNESSMLEIALRGTLTNIQQILIEATNAEGKVSIDETNMTFKLTVDKFDPETGKISGSSNCVYNDDGKWSGQFQGIVFSFNMQNQHCGGTLSWSGETASFVGRIKTDLSKTRTSNAVWKPR